MCSNSMASARDFEANQIKGGCQLGRKVVPPDSKSDLPLDHFFFFSFFFRIANKLPFKIAGPFYVFLSTYRPYIYPGLFGV